LTALLAKAGFEVTPADSGNQALAILAADGPFDVLITDFAMPAMNGADLIARSRVVQPGLRAVVITGFGASGFVDTLPNGTDVLHKPVLRKDLIAAVHRLMGRDQNEWVTSFDGETGMGQTGMGQTGKPRGTAGGNKQPAGSRPFGG
jgi:DNA-binding NtrC family response regulator